MTLVLVLVLCRDYSGGGTEYCAALTGRVANAGDGARWWGVNGMTRDEEN